MMFMEDLNMYVDYVEYTMQTILYQLKKTYNF